MKKVRIIFWITTGLIFLDEGLMPALTGHSEMAIEGITHLGYPIYFVTILTVFKVLGAIALIVPQIPARIKEWAYAGFAIDVICATISIMVVDGFGPIVILPIAVFIVLGISYVSFHKLQEVKSI